jgi:hypothetical protein
MRRSVLASLALASLGLPALGGCATTSPSPRMLADAGNMEVEIDPHGPWTETPRGSGSTMLATDAFRRPAAETRAQALSTPLAASRTPPPAPPAPGAPPLPIPVARGTGEVAKKGAPPVKSIEAMARERFLDHPTEVRADALTLVLPARLLAEARLTGAEVTEPGPGRRVAAGGARLICRELTLVGERITVRTRSDGSEDVQITARGNVDFVSRRAEHVVREQGLRTLIVTNDALTPLR